MFKKTLLLGMLIAVFAVPSVSSASTVDGLLAQIQSLLKTITSLQQQVDGLTSRATPQTVTSATATSSSCPELSRNLWYGLQGDDVASLQTFLKSTGAYTYPVITGYFGIQTQHAVQIWQAENGVVSSGSPKTTGYGAVGPKTRSAISSYCIAHPTLGSSDNATISSTFTATPKIGSIPLTVSFNVPGGTSCINGSDYKIDYGDGSSEMTPLCNPGMHTMQHTYISTGSYVATLSAMPSGGGTQSVVSSVPITVQISGTGINKVTFTASQKVGTAPLTVSFTVPNGTSCVNGPDYKIDYGDGSSEMTPSCSSANNTMQHTYTSVGTYIATLYVIPSSGTQSVVGNISIAVQASGAILNNAKFLVTPKVGTVPLDVSFTVPGGTSCVDGPDYEINYGDGSSEMTPSCSIGMHTMQHTYTSVGTYIATLYAIPSGKSGDKTPSAIGSTPIVVQISGIILNNATFTASQKVGTAPLTVSFTAPGGTGCVLDGPNYRINYGDGSSEMTPLCSPGMHTMQHTYTSVGTYVATLYAVPSGKSGDKTPSIVGNISIAVQASGAILNNTTFTATPKVGVVPLTVSFTAPGGTSCTNGSDYKIDYGDGSSEMTPLCNSGMYTIQHSYTHAGSYVATLYAIPSGGGTQSVVKSISIIVLLSAIK